jgi:hypothetical protein
MLLHPRRVWTLLEFKVVSKFLGSLKFCPPPRFLQKQTRCKNPHRFQTRRKNCTTKFFSSSLIIKTTKEKMTSNIRFTQDGEILGLRRVPTIKFKFYGKFSDFDLLQLVTEHRQFGVMTLKKGGRVKQLSETQVERVFSRFLKYRNTQSAESLTEQYFYPQNGVPKLQETFASEQKTEEFLDVDRFSEFYQSLRIRIDQAK